jgi:hypothetical protein
MAALFVLDQADPSQVPYQAPPFYVTQENMRSFLGMIYEYMAQLKRLAQM